MNNLDKQYQTLLQTILDFGVDKKDRTGTGTKSIFGYTIRHNMKDGFPLLTTKKMAWKSVVTELLWFLKGDTNIKYLVDNDCHIWDGDAYKNYLKNFTPPVCPPNIDVQPSFYEPMSKEMFIKSIQEKGTRGDEFAKKWGELGPIYGKQWRSWKVFKYESGTGHLYSDADVNGIKQYIDQIANLINDLKTNPDSRRLMVNAWNVGELDSMVLPPCHYGFQVYTRELSYEERCDIFKPNTQNFRTETNTSIKDLNIKIMNDCRIPTRAISLMWNQRSVDTFLGLPFNIASYGLLLEIIAKAVNMVPDELIGNLGDVHLYSNHVEQAKEQIGRKYTPEERKELLIKAMGGQEVYKNVVNELMPFGGGMSEYYDIHKIPTHTREPYPLPKLKLETEVKWREGDCLPTYSVSDVTIDDYQSHPTIKAPLSN